MKPTLGSLFAGIGGSYRAMPWKRAKALPPPYLGIELFNAQFRIQREASEAAGHYIPLIVENVRGAQKWVGRANANYGSFFLWGDVGMIGSRVVPVVDGKILGGSGVSAKYGARLKFGKICLSPLDWELKQQGAEVAHPNAGRKVSMNFHEHEKTGIKGIPHRTAGHWTNPAEHEGVKFSQSGGAWFDGKPRDKMLGDKGPAAYGSRSRSRKAASAMIAKIPFPLAQHIARTFKPRSTQ